MYFESEKIILRPLRIEDAEFTLCLRYDEKASKQLIGYQYPVNLDNEKMWINNLYQIGFRSSIYLAIEENSTKKFAGYISIKNINYIHKTADFGIILVKSFRGKGYAMEAMEIFFNYVFKDIAIRKIKLIVVEDNLQAIKLYKKIGFVEEGKLLAEVWQDGKYKNVLLMALFEKNFKA